MELLSESVLDALIVAPIVAFALLLHQRRRIAFAVVFLLLLAFDGAVTGLPIVYDALLVPDARWNWTGKLFSIAWALLFLRFSFLTFREAGFTLKQRPGSVLPATLTTLALTGLGIGIGIVFGAGDALSAETIAYQLTMPGFAEELVYRGALLALLHRAFAAKRGITSFWWPAAITTLAFGLGHGVDLNGWQITFDFLPFLYALVIGTVLVWLRGQTRSLLFPIIAHNASNAAIFLAGALHV